MSGSSFLSTNPRQRRLASDHRRLESLAQESSIFSFQAVHPRPKLGPPETYRVRFHGMGLQYVSDHFSGNVCPIYDHEIVIQLVAEYPRSAPHMRWLTPVFHPNISASGAICLGEWGTHWAPSLQLDRLCEMLWDMLRFANYDTRSPFNQQAANWLRGQREYRFPLDQRELRDCRRLVPAVLVEENNPTPSGGQPATNQTSSQPGFPQLPPTQEEADTLMRFDSPVHFQNPVQHPSQPAPAPPANPEASPPPDILFLD